MPEAPRTRRLRQRLVSEASATVVTSEAIPSALSILAVDEVPFPGNVLTLELSRAKDMALIEDAVRARVPVGVLAPRVAGVVDPGAEELFTVGTVVRLGGLSTRLGSLSFEIQAARRMRVVEFTHKTPYLRARVQVLADGAPAHASVQRLVGLLRERAPDVLRREPAALASDLLDLESVQHAGQLADVVAAQLDVGPEDRQLVLEATDVGERLQLVLGLLKRRRKMLGGYGWPNANVVSYAVIATVVGVYLGIGAIPWATPFAVPLVVVEVIALVGVSRELMRWLR